MGDPRGPGCSKQDLALLVDLCRVARTVHLVPCLIGAGAVQLGAGARWDVRLARKTNDWDIVVRVESWQEYEALAAELETEQGGFVRSSVPHRFEHRDGGRLDVVPYGGLERRPGSLVWPDGKVMDTTGLRALEVHHETRQLEGLELRAASLPANLGLKLLAYRDRRPEIVRDIQDVHSLLREAEEVVPDERILGEGLARLESEEVGFGEVAAYLLGREVGATFRDEELEPMLVLLDSLGEPDDRTAGDVLAAPGAGALTRELVIARFRAFRLGILDR